jgi:hypothetical protein
MSGVTFRFFVGVSKGSIEVIFLLHSVTLANLTPSAFSLSLFYLI